MNMPFCGAAYIGAHGVEDVQPLQLEATPSYDTAGHLAGSAAEGSASTQGSTVRPAYSHCRFQPVQSRCVGRSHRRWATDQIYRRAAAATAAVVLCYSVVLCADPWRVVAEGPADLAAIGSDTRGRAGNEKLTGKALTDVREMYKQNPELVKEFALLTGSTGQKLLSEIQESKKPDKPRVFKGPSLHTLDNYMHQLSTLTTGQVLQAEQQPRLTEAQVHANALKQLNSLQTVEVNKRTAWMLINDLSDDWDKSSNYSATPWEFCAGRNLSPRQIRECTGHLIRVAGVHSHRDLNMNAKIYDRFCTGDGHQYIDKYGSPIILPLGNRAMCAKIVTARTNVDTLLKRQVTMYKIHKDRRTGAVTPAKWEMEGSHGIDCRIIPDGC